MKTLTKAEEQVMMVLWKLEKAFLREMMEEISEPKPHQNTVATILKILVEKEFVTTKTIGRNNEYAPLISREDYSAKSLKHLVSGYFNGSYSNVVSFLVKEDNLSLNELENLLQQIKVQKNGNNK